MNNNRSIWLLLVLAATFVLVRVGDVLPERYHDAEFEQVLSGPDVITHWSLFADVIGLEHPVFHSVVAAPQTVASKCGSDQGYWALLTSGVHALAPYSRRLHYHQAFEPNLTASDIVFPFHAFW